MPFFHFSYDWLILHSVWFSTDFFLLFSPFFINIFELSRTHSYFNFFPERKQNGKIGWKNWTQMVLLIPTKWKCIKIQNDIKLKNMKPQNYGCFCVHSYIISFIRIRWRLMYVYKIRDACTYFNIIFSIPLYYGECTTNHTIQ